MNPHFVSANSFLVNGSMCCIPLSSRELALLFCSHFTNAAFGSSLAQSHKGPAVSKVSRKNELQNLCQSYEHNPTPYCYYYMPEINTNSNIYCSPWKSEGSNCPGQLYILLWQHEALKAIQSTFWFWSWMCSLFWKKNKKNTINGNNSL